MNRGTASQGALACAIALFALVAIKWTLRGGEPLRVPAVTSRITEAPTTPEVEARGSLPHSPESCASASVASPLLELDRLLRWEQTLLEGGEESGRLRDALFAELQRPGIRGWWKRNLMLLLGRAGGQAAKERLVQLLSPVTDADALAGTILAVAIRGVSRDDCDTERERRLWKRCLNGVLSSEAIDLADLRACAPWFADYLLSISFGKGVPLVRETNPLDLAVIPPPLSHRLLDAVRGNADPVMTIAALWYADPGDSLAFDTLRQFVTHENPQLAAEAFRLIGRRRDGDAADVLLTALATESDEDRLRGLSLAMQECSAVPEVQRWAARTLDADPRESAVQIAVGMVGPHSDSRAWASLIGRFAAAGHPLRLQMLLSLSHDCGPALRFVDQIVRLALNDFDEGVRSRALDVAHRYVANGGRAILETAAAADPSPSVRAHAAWYLTH